jgi:hypothetical protein
LTSNALTDNLLERMLERELALRDSKWSIADRQRLLEQTQHLLERAAARGEARVQAIETETAKEAG